MKISFLLSLAAATSIVSAGKFNPSQIRPNVDEIPGAFIIEFEDGVDQVKANTFLTSHKDLDFKFRGQYNLFNGASIQVKSGHTGEDIAKIPGVKRVWPVERYQLPKPDLSNEDKAQPHLTSAHKMTGVDYVQKAFKYTGKGIKVGVIDSGVDYKHPALGGCFGKGCRVRYGWDFVGEDYDKEYIPTPDADPRDTCNGHGTHVAGIIGADARKVGAPQPFVGVAPEVTFGAYRIFSCAGSGSSDIIMLAMELAFNQGMNIINMSLGSGSAFRSTPIAVLADRLTASGLTVVASAGNNGDDGVWMVGNSGLGALSTSVASYDNIAGSYYYFSYAGVEHPYAVSQAWNKIINLPASATLVPVFEKDGALSDGCLPTSYAGQNISGKVVLVHGDTTRCKSGGRGAAAKAAGAAGMLVQSVPLGLSNLGGNPDFPMASIEFGAAEDILAAYKKDSASTLKWFSGKKSFRVEGGGHPSDFSSWGFDGDLHIKPDIAGPGGNILSTYPLDLGSYAIESGTSMSAPYVAGAHALLYSAHKKVLRGQDARKILMNTAVPGSFFNHSVLAPVAKQGSGLVNVKNAVSVQTIFSPDRIELLDSVHFTGKSVDVRIKNVGKRTIVYHLSHEVAESAVSYRGGNSFPLPDPILENHKATVKFSQAKVSVRAGQTAKIKVQFKEPSTGKANEFPFYSGYIVATPQGKDAIPVRIPYAGVKGDVAKVPMLDTDFGLPAFFVADKESGKISDIEKGHKLDFSVEQPIIATRLGSHTPELSLRLFNSKNKFVGYLNTQFGPVASPFGRDKNIDSDTNKPTIRTFSWLDGKVFASLNATSAISVPSGSYKVVVAAQRKLSKGNYPKDFEVYEVADIKV
ncbi:hypothetical protein BX616_000202 [Lobosporangium transversale]|uniref:Peptidase S8/S53 domain-containing protein n=1 Tax=Lobosporangium transversale TaxID=64571 RepID=A0A1Y2GN77_9FUNG|nr:peptidase S8/S53 domain-containing protein [Lobosporangium transversale]KAF9908228.1 hypothetical protein BX616_000202 [Lobosporangium transversale]ORZ16158.1 peptidase S8/S53 domain-containing protein [Lobosporangium transversale]|eukprot:XP_021881505.1 peptidase S8/S53 domain-containing protein [Lobosporangium transversale]